MSDIGFVGLALIILNFAVSYKGFNTGLLFDGYKFEVDRILIDKDYGRLITSGFLHVNWMHLIFNMLSLYAFSDLLEWRLGPLNFAIIYFASLIGGNILALFVHRQHGDYSAVGASGAVCGVIFASIALFPGIGVGFFGMPYSIPSWGYGLLFVGISIFGIKSNKDNIGHEAHLGGALVGMLTAIIMQPEALKENYLPILATVVPTVVFIFLIITRPHILLTNNSFFESNKKDHYDIDHIYNEKRTNKEKELDKLLEKISKKGMSSLSTKEKNRLKELSK